MKKFFGTRALFTVLAVVVLCGTVYARQGIQVPASVPAAVEADKPASVVAAVLPVQQKSADVRQVPAEAVPVVQAVQVSTGKAAEAAPVQADKPAVAGTVTEQPQAAPAAAKLPVSPYQLGAGRDFTFTTRITAKNTGEATSNNVRLEVPLVSAGSVYQSDIAESFSLTPAEIKTVSDTRVAVFALGSLAPGEERVIEIKNQLRVTNPQFFADYRPADRAKASGYLTAGSGIESDNLQIVTLANEITRNLATDWEKARAITHWVAANIAYDAASSNRNGGALQALQNRKGVCEDYAALAAALARAVGIPARVAYGYTDNGNNWPTNGTFALRGYRHAWVEYSLEGRGWVPAEPTRSNPSTLYFGTMPHNRYIIQNYSNVSLKGGFSGGKLSVSWADYLN